ncbi:MAG TPA: DUF4082 domain-containing protein [Verrucomicrobiae bacterium]|nr:DUF4082 domain-containing protein [Verrucomicrobiae bacterium]
MSIRLAQKPLLLGSYSGSFTSAVGAGDTVLLVVTAFTTTGSTITTSSPLLGGSTPTGSTLLIAEQSPSSGGDSVYTAIWMLPNVTGGETTISITVSGNSVPSDNHTVGLTCYDVAGLGSSPSLSLSSSTNGDNGTISSGSIGPLSNTPAFVLASGVVFANTITTVGAPWSENYLSDQFAIQAYQIISAAGSTYDYASTNGINVWAGAIVAIVPGGSGVDSSPYRLFSGVNGPSTTSAPTYSGNFIAGLEFYVSQGNCWFEGYWWWVCAAGNQLTGPTKCVLWNTTGQGSGQVVPNSTVTSGTLTAGWNYIPLATPIQLAIGTPYVAAVGVNGPFPSTQSQFDSGDVYAGGIVSGPLVAYSGTTGGNKPPYGNNGQTTFSVAGSDPATTLPLATDSGGDGATNFWVDVQVSTTAPVGYSGSYRVWPNKFDASQYTSGDSSANYVVGTEIHLSQACTLNAVWYYSPTNSGTTQLATSADVWNIGTQANVATISSPSWSGAAASGWVRAAFAAGTTLAAGSYRVTVYNSASSPDSWSAKQLGYFGYYATDGFRADGQNGITSGPLYTPSTANASMAYEYGGASNSTPPYSNGSQEPGQAIFAMGPPNQFPYLYVDGLFQNYWVDLEVTPLTGGGLNSGAFLTFF